ncbi:histone deacetylase [Vulcanococcus limneticus Candia 3F8]|uniref:histone deacetylase family protein n=1 Tax=Vulcanococcus limneticus TaxID=2170428 RepID=UPI000B98F990|nr:histone deacetylase [Vulcanococcus limneticus]MCP9790441.1 histone deacetylase [Vulcanococcus limneticus MW73D5]MCP9892338.1 histone deacetylase [Vulcanococcus limneticus Candia 3F8]MCP9895840.1 histone deacetylase [Vulcanococcus limneticus Candia 3B3]
MRPPLIYHPAYSAPLPSSHRFPMAKFRLLLALLRRQGLASEEQLHQPLPAPRRWLELVHGRRYHQAFARGQLSAAEKRRIGLPATAPLVRRTWLAVGGTVLTARLALRHGLACHLAGGTHHAFPDHGSGFCIFNDAAVAARVLLDEGLVRRLMVVDLDVHQGDATAAIFAGEPRVFTFSAHCASNFPLRKQRSDLDLPLADGLEDQAYLAAVGDVLPDLLDQQRPELVLYNAGVDPHRGDRLGRLALSSEGLLNRDRLVLDACLRRGIPVATLIGGGYDELTPLVERHGLVFRAAAEQARLHGL